MGTTITFLIAALWCGLGLAEVQSPAVGTIVTVTGQVKLDGVPAVEDTLVYNGQTVTTEEGKAKILFNDDTVVDLGKFSDMVIRKYDLAPTRNVSLRMKKGKIRTSIHRKLKKEGRFRIRTLSSVMAVRGTELLTIIHRLNNEIREQYTIRDGVVERWPIGREQDRGTRLRPGSQLNTLSRIVNGSLVPDNGNAIGGGRVIFLRASEVDNLIKHHTVETTSLEKIGEESPEGFGVAPPPRPRRPASDAANRPPPNRPPPRQFNIPRVPGLVPGDKSINDPLTKANVTVKLDSP